MPSLIRTQHHNLLGKGRPLTAAPDIEDVVVLLRIKPLDYLGSELGHERSRVLVGLDLGLARMVESGGLGKVHTYLG